MSDWNMVRHMEWEGDTLHIRDVVQEISDNAEKQMEESVCKHFDIDMSDLRAYMHDKIAWEQKQWMAMPRWIPVTERLPEEKKMVLCYTPVDGFMCVGFLRTYDWGSKKKLNWNLVTAMRSTQTITKKSHPLDATSGKTERRNE